MGARMLGAGGSACGHNQAFASVEACLSRRPARSGEDGAFLHRSAAGEPHRGSVKHQDGSLQPGPRLSRGVQGTSPAVACRARWPVAQTPS